MQMQTGLHILTLCFALGIGLIVRFFISAPFYPRTFGFLAGFTVLGVAVPLGLDIDWMQQTGPAFFVPLGFFAYVVNRDYETRNQASKN
jgi:hypothetical protein